MSKNKSANKSQRKKSFEIMNRKPTKKIPLKQVLRGVYNIANLESTCSGTCECCKTACPSMNYCEFTQLFDEVWNTSSRSEKIELICKSVEYYMHNEFEKFGMETLVKPCLLLSSEGKCKYYSSRPLNCRMYGLWPSDMYNERVDKFAKAYEGLVTRDQLPLNKQCPNVKRKDNTKPLTKEIIQGLFDQLDMIDSKIGNFTNDQIAQKDNYRTFHDWLLFKIYKEDKLADLTEFMLAANKDTINSQIECLKDAIRKQYAKEMPNLGI